MFVNTIVFKGYWLHQFDTEKTKQGKFYNVPHRTITVPMMSVDAIFRCLTVSRYNFYGDNLKVSNFLLYHFVTHRPPVISLYDDYSYFSNDYFNNFLPQVIELPYSDPTYNMYIFMAEYGNLERAFIESIIRQQTILAFKDHYLRDQETLLHLR